MKKLIATSVLLFVFTVFISVNSYSQTQEKAKTVSVTKGSCGGHTQEAAKTDTTKSGDTPKSCCPKGGTKKCDSSCPHKKAATNKKNADKEKAEPVNTDEKRTTPPKN